MKILLFNSSYRKNGNTAQALDFLEDALAAQAVRDGLSVEMEQVNLAHTNLALCRGCRVCFDRGEEHCPLKDSLLSLRERIHSADALVLASPVYVGDVNAVMKNWIDRMAFVCHRPEMAGKGAFLLLTTGSAPSPHALRTMDVAFRTWGGHTLGKLTLLAGALMQGNEMATTHRAKLEKAAGKIMNGLKRAGAKRTSFLALMIFRIQQGYWRKNPDDSIDYHYWQEKGWLEKDCLYYLPGQPLGLKVLLARAAGALLGRFVT